MGTESSKSLRVNKTDIIAYKKLIRALREKKYDKFEIVRDNCIIEDRKKSQKD